MMNPEAFMDRPDGELSEDFSDGTLPSDAGQPETQEDEPLEAELGENGQGDLAEGDEGGHDGSDAPRDLRDGTV